MKANEVYLSTLQDTVKGFSIIKRSNKYVRYSRVLKNVNRKRSKAYIKFNFITNLIRSIMFSVGSINQLLLTGICAILVTKKMITPGMIIATTSAAVNFMDSMSNLIESRIGMKSAIVFIEKFKPYLQMMIRNNNEVENVNDNFSAKAVISINKLNFAYESNKVIKDFSLNINRGELVAIVGESGSRKSTLINLLLKSFENYDGTIKYNNEDLREIKEDRLYKKVYLVPQESYIFKASLFANISMFDLKTNDVQKNIMKL